MADTGIDDSAILLLSLGAEEAAEVFRHLSPKEAQKLGTAMAALKNVFACYRSAETGKVQRV